MIKCLHCEKLTRNNKFCSNNCHYEYRKGKSYKELYGQKCSIERRKNMSKALKGRTFTKDWKNKISKSLKGREMSDSWKKNMSVARKKGLKSGKIKSPWSYIGRNKGSSQIELMVKSELQKMGFKHNVIVGTGVGGKAKYKQRLFEFDFYREEDKVVIELDGPLHKGREEFDERKNKYCDDKNIKLIRINTIIFDTKEKILNAIYNSKLLKPDIIIDNKNQEKDFSSIDIKNIGNEVLSKQYYPGQSSTAIKDKIKGEGSK